MTVTAFTEVYRPIRNGITSSIDALRQGAPAAGIALTVVAPRFPNAVPDGADIVRIASLPLPTATGYRLCLPFASAAVAAVLEGADVVHAHAPFVTGAIALREARRRGLPLVFSYHTRLDQYAHYVPFHRGLTRRAAVALTRAFADAATIVTVPTRAMEVRLREIGVGVPIRVVPSGIDVERFAAGRRSEAVRFALGARPGERLVLMVSRLGREKNARLVVEALAALPERDVRLVLVGDGPERHALEALAGVLGVADRVTFAGAYASADLPDVYASADVFAFTSVSETQGLVLAEAMAAGLPIAAVSTPVTREVLGDCGLTAAADPARFARALSATLAQPRNECAVHLAFARYTVRTQAERMAAIYSEARERKN